MRAIKINAKFQMCKLPEKNIAYLETEYSKKNKPKSYVDQKPKINIKEMEINMTGVHHVNK